MRAYALPDFDSIGSVVQLPEPTAGDGEILVRVRAASANPVDVAIRAGVLASFLEHRKPLVLGQDYAGTVEAVGPGVAHVKVGDEVFGPVSKPYYGGGSWAELATVNGSLARKRPSHLSPTLAAALPTVGGEAIALVDAAGVKSETIVAIVGAAGGVGSVAVALARNAGALVIAVTRPGNADYVRSLGADEVIESGPTAPTELRERFPAGLDAIIDNYHDVDGLLELAGTVRPGGRIVSPKARSAETAFQGRQVDVAVVNAALDRIDELVDLALEGLLSIDIRLLALADAGESLDALQSASVRGKVVIEPG